MSYRVKFFIFVFVIVRKSTAQFLYARFSYKCERSVRCVARRKTVVLFAVLCYVNVS